MRRRTSERMGEQMMKVILSLYLLAMLGSLPALCAEDHKEARVDLGSQRPLIAVWCADQGWRGGDIPYLRIAIWEDGRVLFAKNTKKWEHKLREGKVSPARIAELKKRIAETAVFHLHETSKTVIDGIIDYILVDVGTKQQELSWDEWEPPGRVIGHDPSPDLVEFEGCWKTLNRLALECRPQNSKPVKGRFGPVPRSWWIESALNSN